MPKARPKDTRIVAGRIPLDVSERLDKVTDRSVDPRAMTVGRIVAWGVHLALEKLEQERPSK